MIQTETVLVLGVRNQEKFERFHTVLKELFPHVFSTAVVEDFDGSLLLRWAGKHQEKPIMLLSHHDVVAASGQWQHEPFSGDIADGRIWGRGTTDNKNNLFAMLQAVDELIAEGYVPEQDIYIESACTEETDGSGADKISQALQERGIRFFLTLDEGGMVTPGGPLGQMDKLFAMVGVAEKAMVNLKFTARGRGGHASTPCKNTPLVRLGKFMAAVEDSDTLFTERMSEITEETLLRISDDQDETTKFLFQHARALQPMLQQHMPGIFGVEGASLKTTIAFTMCQGSDAANVLPREAYVIGNMRISHHQGAEDSIRRIRELAERFDIETEVMKEPVESTVTNYKGEAFQLLESLIHEFFPEATILPFLLMGGTDNRFFSRVCDSCLRFAPFTCDIQQVCSAHNVDENLSLSTLVPAVDFYRRLIQAI